MNKINKILLPYFFIIYILFILTGILFTCHIRNWTTAGALIIFPALFFYPFLQLLPEVILTYLAARLTQKLQKWQLGITGFTAVLSVFAVHLFLLLDAGLYFRYGYHVNPHVINIFTTPGGFEGMGMLPHETALLGLGIVVLALFHAGIFLTAAKFEKIQLKEFHFRRRHLLLLLFPVLAFAISHTTYTYSHYMMNPIPLQTAECIPFFLKGTSGTLYKKLGIKKPERDALMVKFSKKSTLQAYPAVPIRRKADHPRYNVLWLACESWGKKLFTPEIMPNTAKFAEKGILFNNHYSGGNVTRQGVFSMFYALPGNYWHAFFAARRGPVFLDWLREDGYAFECITSSKFSYPEFDQTVFSTIRQKDLRSDSAGFSYERDQRNVKHLLKVLEEGAASDKPFFNFMFFESCHHPYSFPPEAAYYKDYIEPFNAVNVTPADGPKIFKRAANSARHLDMRLGEVFRFLEEKDLMKNTIVILTGDHGEEYFEKGKLGHSSAFNNEQTKTTLILYYPGVQPRTYEGMSSHLDIIPMLSGFFGVENKPADYSCGINLLELNAQERQYSLIANWDKVFFAGKKYKSYIPLDAEDLAKQTVSDANDKILSDVSPFYKEYNKELIKVQHDLTRFTTPFGGARKGRKTSAVPQILLPVLLLSAAIGSIFWCRRKNNRAEKE